MTELKQSAKNERVLKILKGLGAEDPEYVEDPEGDLEPTLEALSPSERRRRDAFRRRYGAYTKPGPDAQSAPSLPPAAPKPGFNGY